ncbi:hypothetical protein EIV52_12490 [Salmonella enterica]|nr:hypothetical protein [Salmonella enterica]EDQ4900263.1 hypothetical protein [Salmonella enterica]
MLFPSHPRLPYRRPAERFTPDNDALVVDVDNITSKFCYLQVKCKKMLFLRAQENRLSRRLCSNVLKLFSYIFDDTEDIILQKVKLL